MEFKINKVDVELIQRINEVTAKEKVHGSKEIQKLALDKEKLEEKDKKKYNMSKKKSNKRIEITADKNDDTSIKVEAFKEKDVVQEKETGYFLDVRK